jgi:hypothetical protein
MSSSIGSHQDENRQRHHIVLERRRSELETFDSGQHRNRRRNHGISDEHRSADDAQRQQWPASPAQRALTQRHQRKRATLAVIVGAQQQQNVFCGDDDKSAHRISDRTPSTMTRVIGWPCAAAVAASRNACSGDVPISPNTTPMLPSVRAQKPVVTGPSWASVDVTLTAMMEEKALSVDLIRVGYRRFHVKGTSKNSGGAEFVRV